MNSSEMNNILRDMFKKLVEDGFPKNPMCAVTLGTNANPYFNKFLDGTELGIKPLARMIEGLGYDLHLVPVKKDDAEAMKKLEADSEEFIGDAMDTLKEFLENHSATPRASGGGRVAAELSSAVDGLFEEL